MEDKTLEFELQVGILLFNIKAHVIYSEEVISGGGVEPNQVNIEIADVCVEECELLVNKDGHHIDNDTTVEITNTDAVIIADTSLTDYIWWKVDEELHK